MVKISSSYPIPENMEEIINSHTVGLGIIGIPGGLLGPGADLPAIAASWVMMTIALAEEAGHRMEQQTAKKICLAVATGAGSFLAGSKIAATAAGWITAFFTAGVSLVVAAAGNAALNATFTRAYGRSCARLFLQTGSIESSEVIVRALITLIGVEMGIKGGGDVIV